MSIQVLAGALLVAAAVPVLVFTVAVTGSRFGRKPNVLSDPTDVRQHVLTRSRWERIGQPMAQSLGANLVRVSPRGWADKIDRKLVLAGLSGGTSVERVLLLKAVLGIGLFLFGWVFIVPLIPAGWLVTFLLGALGFVLPDVWLSRRADERQQRIQLELPDVLDQITMSVEAGLGFEAALARAARAGDGPLAEELRRVVKEMHLGISRWDALRNLADRTEVPDLKSFVVTVVQSEQYGLAITKILSVQAAELRDKRQQRAEERALKIPVLLIMPLAVCIFPTLFIILLGPALIRIYRDLTILGP